MSSIRKVAFGPRDVEVERGAGGSLYLRSPHALAAYPARLTERLDYWAQAAPGRVLLAQRDGAGWRTLTYAQARERARRVAQYLLRKELSPGRPLLVLSGNDLEHALLHLGAMYAGIPYAPISPAYSLLSTDFGKLRAIFELLTPGLVFAKGEQFGRAFEQSRQSLPLPQTASADVGGARSIGPTRQHDPGGRAGSDQSSL